MDKIVMEMDDDHVTINASDIVMQPFSAIFNEIYVSKKSMNDPNFNESVLDR